MWKWTPLASVQSWDANWKIPHHSFSFQQRIMNIVLEDCAFESRADILAHKTKLSYEHLVSIVSLVSLRAASLLGGTRAIQGRDRLKPSMLVVARKYIGVLHYESVYATILM